MSEVITIEGDTAVTPTTFDFSSAWMIVDYSFNRHTFYRNAAGSICLTVVGRLQGGKVAIRPSAIERLDRMPGAHFIRVINEDGMTDVIAPRDAVQLGDPQSFARSLFFVVARHNMPDDAQDLN